MEPIIKNIGKIVYNTLNDNVPSLNEMAEIGSFKAKKMVLTVFIWSRDPRNIPHIHIGDENTYPDCFNFQTCIKLTSPEYFPHGGKYTDTLNNKQIEQLIKFLKAEEDGVSNWKFIIQTWNRNSSNIKLPVDTPMPDYTLLNN